MMRPVWPMAASLLAMCLHAGPARAAEPARPADPEAAKFFETKIRPVLVARCYKCHGPESKPEGNLRLDSLAGMLAGGDIGPAIKPGDAKASLLIDAINHGDVVQMPPKTKLPANEIADLTAWVSQGAPGPTHRRWPRTLRATPLHTRSARRTATSGRFARPPIRPFRR